MWRVWDLFGHYCPWRSSAVQCLEDINLSVWAQTGRVLALIGGTWGTLVILWVSSQQIQVGPVLRGEIPLSVAVTGMNALPFLSFTLVACIAAIGLALSGQRVRPLMAGLVWVLISFMLGYGVYLSRFSIGPLLLPATLLILLAGIIALVSGTQRQA